MKFTARELRTKNLVLTPVNLKDSSISFEVSLTDNSKKFGEVYVYSDGSIDARVDTDYLNEVYECVAEYVKEHELAPSMWID